MILTDEQIQERIESPLNLLNRLKSITSLQTTSPCFPPSSEQIIDDLTEKLAYGSIKSKAAGIMTAAMDELKIRLPEVTKPEKLAQIASEMSKVVNAADSNKREERSDKPQIIIYAPQVVSENHFETMLVNE